MSRRLALCVSATGIRSMHQVEMGAVIPRTLARRKVIMTMPLTVRTQQLARRWCSDTPLGTRINNISQAHR